MRVPFEFRSFEEVTVKGYVWKGEQAPIGVMILAHGMAETILRYDAFATYLAAQGIVVYGYSHRGHFETAGSLERLGYLGKEGWSKMAEDLNTVVNRAKAEVPNVPVCIFGHSMGSYVTRTYLVSHPSDVDKVILSGTGYPQKLELQAAAFVARCERTIKRADLPSKLLDKLSFGSFNKAFAPTKTPFDWLSTDPVEVQKYIDNPWCGQIHPASFFEDMAKNLARVLYGPMPKPKSTVPMLLMSGALDPVGQMGKGVEQSAAFYKEAGYEVTLKLYPKGRHEMLNERNREEVYQDILKWIIGGVFRGSI